MLFSEAMGRQIVSTESADTLGQIAEYIVDPRAARIAALAVGRPTGGSTLPWANIRAFGVDAVTVSSAADLVEPDAQLTALAGKAHVLSNKRVLSTAGVDLGSVRDVEFDPTDGRVIWLLLERQPIEGPRMLGIGSYAVVVRDGPG